MGPVKVGRAARVPAFAKMQIGQQGGHGMGSRFLRPLMHHQTPVHVEGLAGDVAGAGAGQE